MIQLIMRGSLVEQQAGTGIQERFSIPLSHVERETDDLQVWMFSYDVARRFDAVHSWHVIAKPSITDRY